MRTVKDPIEIWQVLLIQNGQSSRIFGGAVWASFLEVEAFYNQDEQRVIFDRTYLSEASPLGILDSSFGASQGLDWREVGNEFWDKARGKFSKTYDQKKLVVGVRDLSGGESLGTPVIVTDQEITPPKHWRYIIWDATSKGVVIAIPPTDPNYWRENNDDRVTAIKNRIRSACLNVVGGVLGLKRCDNPRCFMFGDVDSVLRLDEMVLLGKEHKSALPNLINKGFELHSPDPNKVQSIVEFARTEGSPA
jgi:hypothetical protein